MTTEQIFSVEPVVRLGMFAAVLAGMALWEVLAPRRAQDANRVVRWPSNLGIVVIDTVVVRVLFPITAVGLAMGAERNGFGLLNAWAVPALIAVPFSVIVLDLVIYLQHVMFHAVPGLWRLHRMHHADLALDATSGTRFHPVEIALSMVIKLAVIAALGAPALAVLIFEVLLNATSMFNHANARIPAGVEGVLRWFVVTPDMHRVHHSVVVAETNSNFGFNLPLWDRLFGTYRAQPAAGHDGMIIGIDQFRGGNEQHLLAMLTQPFREGVGRYPLGRRDEGEG